MNTYVSDIIKIDFILHMTLVFNEYMGPERRHREYKEFNLYKTGIPFSISTAEHYCESNQFAFDELIRTTLTKYIKEYIPKYACAFWNASIINGELCFGIDDDGFIKGIPLSLESSFDKNTIITLIMDTIRQLVKRTDEESIDLSSVSVDIVPVENPPVESGRHPDYEKYMIRKRQYEQEYQQYIQQYKDWEQTYEIFNSKLTEIVNTPHYRKVLIQFMEESDHRNETALQTIYDDTFLLPYMSGEDIKDLKLDHSNLFYWVTYFKDELCKKYKKDKPVFYARNKYKNLPFTLLSNVSDMIPYWSEQIHLYVIRINCGTQPTNDFMYYNGTQWIRCNRIIDPYNQQPICMPE